jgi:hypothetical protein
VASSSAGAGLDLLLVEIETRARDLTAVTDWYDNEHVPARMDFPEFAFAARYYALDDAPHSWLAYYHVESTFLESEPYAELRRHRSDRETRVMASLVSLRRRVLPILAIDGTPQRSAPFLLRLELGGQDSEDAVEWSFDKGAVSCSRYLADSRAGTELLLVEFEQPPAGRPPGKPSPVSRLYKHWQTWPARVPAHPRQREAHS